MVDKAGGEVGSRDATAAAPRRRGPKGKNPEEGRRISHSIRLKPSTAAKLREEAGHHHRTLGEEMEYRLNRSFSDVSVLISVEVLGLLKKRADDNNRTIEQEASIIIERFISSSDVFSTYSNDDHQKMWFGIFQSLMAKKTTDDVIEFLRQAPDKAWETAELPNHIDNVTLKMVAASKMMSLLVDIMNMPADKAARIKVVPAHIEVSK